MCASNSMKVTIVATYKNQMIFIGLFLIICMCVVWLCACECRYHGGYHTSDVTEPEVLDSWEQL